jgi:hypothetical protein
MRKVDYLLFLKNCVKGDRCTLINAWGTMMLYRHMLHQKWTAESPRVACAWGVMILK